MAYSILVTEDNDEIRQLITACLEEINLNVIQASNGKEALNSDLSKVDLALVDLMMPEMGGYELIAKIRENHDFPILVISALSLEENQLQAYHIGADDYIVKPFSPSILQAKVMGMVKRYRREEKLLSYKELVLNCDSHELSYDDQVVNLTKKEYVLLECFIKHPKQLFSRESLVDYLWGYDYLGDLRVVDTYVGRLRRKMGPYGNYIETFNRSGYRLGGKDENSI